MVAMCLIDINPRLNKPLHSPHALALRHRDTELKQLGVCINFGVELPISHLLVVFSNQNFPHG